MVFNPLVYLTSRSQYPRLKTVLKALEDDPEVDLTVVIAGGALTHDYGDLTDILTNDGIDIDIKLHNLLEGGESVVQGKTTGLALMDLSTVFTRENPDTVLITGDRYEIMAATLASSYQNIPVCHFEGGEITGSIDEKVRHATTKMADYHFVSTQAAKEVVTQLGEEPTRIFHTGCPSIDIAEGVRRRGQTEFDPQLEIEGVGAEIDVSKDYIVIQFHPLPTEYQSNEERTWELIEAIDSLDIQAFWFWPNMDSGTDQVSSAIRNYRELHDPDDVKFYINLSPENFLTLIRGAACMVGNSSVGIRECSYLGTPTVNIGERQRFRERARNVVDVQCNSNEIEQAIRRQVSNGNYEKSTLYGDGTATDTIVDILKSTKLELKSSMNPEHLEGIPAVGSQPSHIKRG